jgi:hypothetical protein
MPVYPRYGHSGVIYQKKFIVYGGKVKSITYHLMGELDIYDLNENTWSSPGFTSKAYLPARRNHIAEIVGHHMFVHGGTGEDNEIYGDCYILSLSPYKWLPAAISDVTPSPHLTGHSSCLVVPAEYRLNTRMNIYKYPEIGFGKIASNKVKKIFIYFYFYLYFLFIIIFIIA